MPFILWSRYAHYLICIICAFMNIKIKMLKNGGKSLQHKLERAVDVAPSQIPTLKFLTPPPAPTSPTPGHDSGNRMKIMFNMFLSLLCENTHKEFGIKIFEIDMLMIFDLLTSSQGHKFDPRIKMLLAFCSACHPRRFDMPHDHVWKKNTPWAPPVPRSHTPGA